MQNFDLETMSLDDLKSIKRNLDKAITNFDQRRKAEAKRDLEAKAREHGFSLAELVDSIGSKRSPVAAKYRNPDNADQTWSGRGRQPIWYKNALENGADPDTLAI